MGMVVRTNYSALNATRNLNKNSSGLASSLEKLASGFKINKAADDASGLAISEKMKAQIKSLDSAAANCEDGVSMIQTTEGYLSEVHDMLNRAVELAEKSANGTYENPKADDGSGTLTADEGVIYNGSASTANAGAAAATNAGTDRDALQAEMNQLCAEIDRIAATANFNNVKLFTGSLQSEDYSIIDGDSTGSGLADFTTTLADGATTVNVGKTTIGGTVTAIDSGTPASTVAGVKLGTGLSLQIGETSTNGDKLKINVMRLHTDTLFSDLCEYTNADGKQEVAIDINADSTVLDSAGNTLAAYTIDISGQKRASAAAEALRGTINTVSKQRADLGAMQNRLDHTINNLNTASENVTSANSRIRDTDMAKEMTKYTQMNVLSQAAQAMLAQANSQPQNALQLLQ